jgi:hypothetical protein
MTSRVGASDSLLGTLCSFEGRESALWAWFACSAVGSGRGRSGSVLRTASRVVVVSFVGRAALPVGVGAVRRPCCAGL